MSSTIYIEKNVTVSIPTIHNLGFQHQSIKDKAQEQRMNEAIKGECL